MRALFNKKNKTKKYQKRKFVLTIFFFFLNRAITKFVYKRGLESVKRIEKISMHQNGLKESHYSLLELVGMFI